MANDADSDQPAPLSLHCLLRSFDLVTQSVKRWSADLAVPGSISASGGVLFNHERCSIAHSLSLSHAHLPVMTEILLNRALHQFIVPILRSYTVIPKCSKY